MLYTATVDTVANTSRGEPLSTILQATSGIVVRSEFYFPPGPSGLVGIQVRVANVQISPVDRDEWLIGDNVTIEYADFYGLDTEPFQLEIRTYNDDTEYDHRIQYRCVVMNIDAFTALYGRGITHEELNAILQGITDATSKASQAALKSAFEVL